MKHRVVALLLLGLALSFGGAWNLGAAARPDKTPDRTLDDHPSGKDKTAEPGRSGTQGTSASDPDGDANGGLDKPGGDGGFDTDQDGNNGCGNDDDFEDDNNGNCGGRQVALKQALEQAQTDTDDGARVLGVSIERMQADVAVPTKVAGATAVRSTGALAATGAESLLMVGVALQLLCVGGLLRTAA